MRFSSRTFASAATPPHASCWLPAGRCFSIHGALAAIATPGNGIGHAGDDKAAKPRHDAGMAYFVHLVNWHRNSGLQKVRNLQISLMLLALFGIISGCHGENLTILRQLSPADENYSIVLYDNNKDGSCINGIQSKYVLNSIKNVGLYQLKYKTIETKIYPATYRIVKGEIFNSSQRFIKLRGRQIFLECENNSMIYIIDAKFVGGKSD